jgi:adenylate kinase family enzyme
VKRVVVQGTSGSGKTTVARTLAGRLGVAYVELDALNHGPNWSEASDDELRQRVLAAIDGRDDWVVDGNYERKFGDLVLERADTVVWLDLPLRVCLARLWRRTSGRIRDDVELWNGNKESWRGVLWGRDSLFAWTVRSHVRRRRTFAAHLERLPNLDVVRLRSAGEVEAWLSTQAPPSAEE